MNRNHFGPIYLIIAVISSNLDIPLCLFFNIIPPSPQLSSAESSLRSEQAHRLQLANQLTAEQQRSWRLADEARDLHSQLRRAAAMAGPMAMAQGPMAVEAPVVAETPRQRPEMRDKVSLWWEW